MQLRTILFDIGGVLTHDGHETYLLDPAYGLLRHSDISPENILIRTTSVFRKYATVPSANESQFWNEISQSLDTPLTKQSIAVVKQQIQTINTEVEKTFQLLHSKGITIGIISNSTPFFYPSMAESLRFDEYVDPDLYFLSHREGKLKSSGLFELAASRVDPACTHIIDDRMKNVLFAQNLGFSASQYSIFSGDSLLELVIKIADGAI